MAAVRKFDIVRAAVLGEVPHGFFGSAGGVHQFGYGGPGEPGAVHALRAAAASAIVDGSRLVAPHQVHSPDVITVAEGWEDTPRGRPEADALVTDRRGIVLGIVTADCAPVLFADRQAGIIGAAHAGWRGAQGGVLENTIDAMEALGAARADIDAAIGPTIAQPSYEVDAAFRENFDPADEPHFSPAPAREGRARWHFDLPGYVSARLDRAGVGRVEDIARDTFTDSAAFYSYRRSTQAGEPNYGRQISMIALA